MDFPFEITRVTIARWRTKLDRWHPPVWLSRSERQASTSFSGAEVGTVGSRPLAAKGMAVSSSNKQWQCPSCPTLPFGSIWGIFKTNEAQRTQNSSDVSQQVDQMRPILGLAHFGATTDIVKAKRNAHCPQTEDTLGQETCLYSPHLQGISPC